MTGIGRRIQWLLPVEREVYKTERLATLPEDVAWRCVRCGAAVHGSRGLRFFTRKRGTSWQEVEHGEIHRRCVPTKEFETAGLPARKVRRA